MTELVPVNSAAVWQTLLLEQHHLTDNEFTSAINLVSVAAVRADNAEVKTALDSLVELLHEHNDVHRLLRMPERDVLVDAAYYLQKLGFAMSRSRLDRMEIRLVFAADTLPLQSHRCWRLGLIVHELIANSARHACFGGQDGQIRVELARSGPSVSCTVSDNGSAAGGLRAGRGLRIVSDLVKSLGGRIRHRFGPQSTSFVLVFPLTHRELQANRAVATRRARTARRQAMRPSPSSPLVKRRGRNRTGLASELHVH